MKKTIINYVYSWTNKGYKNGIPDAAPTRLEQLNKVPSYRQICKAILTNDTYLERLGLSKPKCKVYHEIKKAELIKRGVIKESNQLKLKL
jgi:predicted phosphoadenosine phosphosulfate sulfurtransferase